MVCPAIMERMQILLFHFFFNGSHSFETFALSNLTIWSCFIKLVLKAGLQAAGTPPCLHASLFEEDLVYGRCLLFPSITCGPPTALSQPAVCTWAHIHIAVKSNDDCVLGNIEPRLGRLAESVTSPSQLAFSAETLM